MSNARFISIAGLLCLLTACSSARKPSNENFARAINIYLAKHGEVCMSINRQFPVDLPRSEQNEQYGIGPKLAALEQAGLLHATDTTAVVHGMLDPLRGSGPAQPVKRYELTETAKKYFQQMPSGPFGQSSGFCYGHKSVDAIVKWTELSQAGSSSQTEVTYTYKIADAATWAQRPDVRQAFPDIRATLDGISKKNEVAGLQLTSEGWEIPER